MLYKLTLQTKLQHFVINNVFLDKKVKTQQNKKSNKYLSEPGIEPGTSRNQSGCVTTAPLSQLKKTIVVELFNCFDAMG